MAGASFLEIDYSLRPNKSIERKVIFEFFASIRERFSLSDYTYVGFGSMWFVDFVMAHRTLGIKDMVSFEKTKKGAIILAALSTPKRTGSVLQPAASSPFMSEKSFEVMAPRMNRKKIAPMNHGSKWKIDATIDHPATLRRQPRGIAIVRFARKAFAFVLPAKGALYTNVKIRPAR